MMIAFAVCALLLSVPTIVSQAAHKLSPIKSHGTIIYKTADESKIVEFYASDIQYLHDELDKLFAELPDYSSTIKTTSAPVNSFNIQTSEQQTEEQDRLGDEIIITE